MKLNALKLNNNAVCESVILESVQRSRESSRFFLKKEANRDLHQECLLLNEKMEKNVFFFPPILSFGIVYRDMARHIDSHSVYSFNFIECENPVKEYAGIITGVQPKGPYMLFGQSAGGNVAFEVAKELCRLGHDVTDLILMDCYFVDKLENDSITPGKKKEYAEEIVNMLVNMFPVRSMDREQVEDHIGRKVKGYLAFLNTFATRGRVDADIHFVKSSGDTEAKEAMRKHMGNWSDCTTRRYIEYQGFGKHDDMLSESFAEKNAGILKKILYSRGCEND